MVLAEVLVEAGLTLIHEAEIAPGLSELARARRVRNGLMVALLAMCPIRLKNFAALEIGRSFVEIKGKWWIVLAASETKEERPDERPVDDMLKPAHRALSRELPAGAGPHRQSAFSPLALVERRNADELRWGRARDQGHHRSQPSASTSARISFAPPPPQPPPPAAATTRTSAARFLITPTSA